MQNFLELVARMRQSQKEYFQMRTQHNLKMAKAFEAKVDEAIKLLAKEQINDITDDPIFEPSQAELFQAEQFKD